MPIDLRTLVITSPRVFPTLGGAAVRNWQNVNILAEFGPVGTFTLLDRPSQPDFEQPDLLELAVEHLPEADRHRRPLGQRLRDDLWPVRPLGYPRTDRLFDDDGKAKLHRVLRRLEPNLVIFEELWAFRYFDVVRHHSDQSVKIVYDAHNVEGSLRQSILHDDETARVGQGSWRQSIKSRSLIRGLRDVERHLANAADQVWVCSHDDREELTRLYGLSPSVTVVPNGVKVDEFESASPLPQRAGRDPIVLFVGSFGYAPNAQAAGFMIQVVLPRVWRVLPRCRLVLVGRDPTSPMRLAASRDSRVSLTGTVPDVRPFLTSADVVVAPLLVGGGTRLKILEAFAARRPVVTTSKGAQGLMLKDGTHALIRDDPDDFAKAVIELIESKDLAGSLTAPAYELVASRYDWQAVALDVRAALVGLFGQDPMVANGPRTSPRPRP